MWRVAVLLATLAPAVVRATQAPDTAAERPAEVHYADGRLSVRLDGVPLDRVVAAVGAETGLAFRGELLDWREVHKEFDAVPLAEALDRLLGRQNFVLRYDGRGAPYRVDLLGLPVPRTGPSPGKSRPSNALQALAKAQSGSLSPPLRQAMRANTVNLTQLLMASVQQESETVRAEARLAFLRAVERNREVRDALAQAPPQTIVALLRPLPADRSQATLVELERRAGDPVLRGAFQRIRTQLQQSRTAQAARASRR